MQFAPRLMPRPSDSHDHPTPLPTSLSLSFARPPRSVLTNQSRVQDGLFYGCGDGLMDFEVPDAISARAGGREGERARGEATPERNFQGSRQPSQGKATRKATVSFRGRCRTVGDRVCSNLQLVKLASPSPLSFRLERVETKFYRLQVPTPRQPKFTSSGWGSASMRSWERGMTVGPAIWGGGQRYPSATSKKRFSLI